MSEQMTKKKTTPAASSTKEKKVEVSKVSDIKKTYEPMDEIECVSVAAGELIMIGKKTGNTYVWANYGDSTLVEYQDLKAEKLNRLSRYIYDPLIMINDEDLINTAEFSNVAEIYQNASSVEDLEEMFSLDNISFARALRGLPVGLKNTVKSMAVTKIADGSLDSIKKIKEIDEVLGTDLFNIFIAQ